MGEIHLVFKSQLDRLRREILRVRYLSAAPAFQFHVVVVAALPGGDTPYTTCPECGADAYVMEEECCALCGEAAEHTCARCGSSIPAEEMSCSPYCGYCDHMMSKDD